MVILQQGCKSLPRVINKNVLLYTIICSFLKFEYALSILTFCPYPNNFDSNVMSFPCFSTKSPVSLTLY